MENQIDFYTNELMDKLVSESEFKANSLCLMVPLSYAMNLVELNWTDIYFAYINGYINKTDVIYFAVNAIEKGCSNQIVFSLADLNAKLVSKDELLYDYFSELIHQEVCEETREKLLYIILHFLYDKRNQFEDPFQAVEVVYADFSYPILMEGFVRFMIPFGNVTSSLGESDMLMSNWKKYLDEQAIRYNTEQSGDSKGK